MTTSAVGSTTSSTGAITSSTGTATPSTLSQSEFLKLMTSQLQYQDPLNPVSNSEFMSQMAEISTVTGINTLNNSFSTLSSNLTSNQALEATSLVGKNVMVQSDSNVLTSTGMTGAVGVPSSGDVQIQISDSTGALVKSIDMGTQSAGIVNYSWDGKDASGNTLAPGTYSVSAQVLGGGSSVAATTYAVSNVQSVALDSSGIYVNLNGLGSAAFSKVVEIM